MKLDNLFLAKSLFLCLLSLYSFMTSDAAQTEKFTTENKVEVVVYYQKEALRDQVLPVFFLYSYDYEGKPLEAVLLALVEQGKIFLVVLEESKKQNTLRQVVENFEIIEKMVRTKYSVHPVQNYVVGVMEGAVISAAIAVKAPSRVAGLLLFDGIYYSAFDKAYPRCPLVAYAKTGSAEWRDLTKFKGKAQQINPDIELLEYQKESELPDAKEIGKSVENLCLYWIKRCNDVNSWYQRQRVLAIEQDLKQVNAYIEDKQFKEAFFALEVIETNYKNATSQKIIAFLNKADKDKGLLVQEKEVQSLLRYREIVKEKELREVTYENLLDTVSKLERLLKEYSETEYAVFAKKQIEEIQEVIKIRRLDIPNALSSSVVFEYMKFLETSKINPSVFALIKKEYDQCVKKNDLTDLIMNSLIFLNEDYADGIVAFGMNKLKIAAKKFDQVKIMDNRYLTAYQLYYRGRICVVHEDFENAESIFSEILKNYMNYMTHQSEVFFLTAMCCYRQMKMQEAKSLLREFEKRFPDAPERMRIGAYQLLSTIENYEENSLSEIEERMDYASRRLKLKSFDTPATENQDRIITVLDKLIEEAEQSEQNNRNKMKNRKEQKQSSKGPENPAEDSQITEGETHIGKLQKYHRGAKEDAWGADREKERKEVLNALKVKFPDRYKELIEQYYKGLQKSE